MPIVIFVSVSVYFLVRFLEKVENCRAKERILARFGKDSQADSLEQRFLALKGLAGNLVSPLIRRRRLQVIEEQLPDFLLFIANALRASFSIRQAIGEASRQMAAPLGEELRILQKELEFGMGLEEALRNMVGRLPLKDLDLTTAALITGNQAGGNLVYILDSLSEAIRERQSLKRDIQVLTSQGRLSGLILSGLPAGFLLFMLVFSRERAAALMGTNLGWLILLIGLFLNLAGFFWIRRIVAIEV